MCLYRICRWGRVGSLRPVRYYSVGGDARVRAFVSGRAAVTVSHGFRRARRDAAADSNQHRFVAGLSIWFRNGRDDSP
jgi:hypothetical protein